jgi:hypothetical protein
MCKKSQSWNQRIISSRESQQQRGCSLREQRGDIDRIVVSEWVSDQQWREEGRQTLKERLGYFSHNNNSPTGEGGNEDKVVCVCVWCILLYESDHLWDDYIWNRTRKRDRQSQEGSRGRGNGSGSRNQKKKKEMKERRSGMRQWEFVKSSRQSKWEGGEQEAHEETEREGERARQRERERKREGDRERETEGEREKESERSLRTERGDEKEEELERRRKQWTVKTESSSEHIIATIFTK